MDAARAERPALLVRLDFSVDQAEEMLALVEAQRRIVADIAGRDEIGIGRNARLAVGAATRQIGMQLIVDAAQCAGRSRAASSLKFFLSRRPGIFPSKKVLHISFRYLQDIQTILFRHPRDISMILTIGNTKGGVGKTTIAINIAIARALQGRDVLLVDGDEQPSATTFSELRTQLHGKAGYTAIILQGAAIRSQVRQLAPKYDDIVIDVGGRDTGSMRAALTVSDVFLVPVQPRTLDVWAIGATANLVSEARVLNDGLQAFSFLNKADHQGNDNSAAADELREAEGIRYLDIPVGDRKAFPNALAAGKAVMEQKSAEGRDQKAIAELDRLVEAIYTRDIQEISNGYRKETA
jgi:chromosome partitioning protein